MRVNLLPTHTISHKTSESEFVCCGRFILCTTKQRRHRGQIYQIYCRIRRLPKSHTFSYCTHSITGDNYSTPTNLLELSRSTSLLILLFFCSSSSTYFFLWSSSSIYLWLFFLLCKLASQIFYRQCYVIFILSLFWPSNHLSFLQLK